MGPTGSRFQEFAAESMKAGQLHHIPKNSTPSAHQQVNSQRSACLRGNVAESARRRLGSIYEGHYLGAYNSGNGIIIGAFALLLGAAENQGDISYRRVSAGTNV